MSNVKDGLVKLIYKGGGLPEGTLMEDSPIIFAAQFREDTAGIADPCVVNSVLQLCKAFDVRIAGDVTLPGRSAQRVEIKALGAESYDFNGMTITCRPLLVGYASWRALEAYHRFLIGGGQPLTPDDLKNLTSVRRLLIEASGEPDASELGGTAEFDSDEGVDLARAGALSDALGRLNPIPTVQDVISPGLPALHGTETFTNLLEGTDLQMQIQRVALAAQIGAIADLHAEAGDNGVSERALQLSEEFERAWETSCVALRQENAMSERSVRLASIFFDNLSTSLPRFEDKIAAVNVDAQAFNKGSVRTDFQNKILRHHFLRPDIRNSAGYMIVPGWMGSAHAVKEMARLTHEHRCVMITDTPDFKTRSELKSAAAPKGFLESCSGEADNLRHSIMLANWGKIRERYVGKHASEDDDLYAPLSSSWFAHYLDRIAQGEGWRPPVGHQGVIANVDGCRLDMLLGPNEEALTSGLRVNAGVRRMADSPDVMLWSAKALSSGRGGMQLAPSIVEMIVIRMTDQTIKKHAHGQPAGAARSRVQDLLSDFVSDNSGVGRMFRAGSTVAVTTNGRKLSVKYNLKYHELIDEAEIVLSADNEDENSLSVIESANYTKPALASHGR